MHVLGLGAGGQTRGLSLHAAYRPSGSLCLQEWEYSPHDFRAGFADKIFPYFLLYRLPRGYEKHNTRDSYTPCVSLGLRNFYARVKIS